MLIYMANPCRQILALEQSAASFRKNNQLVNFSWMWPLMD